jgi:hypothetical protein
MENALALIESGGCSILEAALSVGYANQPPEITTWLYYLDSPMCSVMPENFGLSNC